MGKFCSPCNYYSENNDEAACPTCNGKLQFTLLGPRTFEASTEKPGPGPQPWDVKNLVDVKFVEAPLNRRVSQIIAAIFAYLGLFFLSLILLIRIQISVFLLHGGKDAFQAKGFMINMILFVILPTICAIISSMGCVNWLPQCLGFAAPYVALYLGATLYMDAKYQFENVFWVLILLMTSLGAGFYGHILFPASRVQKTLDELLAERPSSSVANNPPSSVKPG